jgi:hypothetical protein
VYPVRLARARQFHPHSEGSRLKIIVGRSRLSSFVGGDRGPVPHSQSSPSPRLEFLRAGLFLRIDQGRPEPLPVAIGARICWSRVMAGRVPP